MPLAGLFPARGCRATGGRDAQRRKILLLQRRERAGQLPLRTHLQPDDPSKLRHQHKSCRLLGLLLVPPRPRAPWRFHMDTPRALHQTPAPQRQPSDPPQGCEPLGLLQAQTIDKDGVLQKSAVVLDAVLLFVGSQDRACAMGHLPLRGHSRPQHATRGLLALAHDHCRLGAQRCLQSIVQGFARAWLVTPRPPRAILGAFLDPYIPLVIRAGQCAQLLGCGLGLDTAAIGLLGHGAHGRLQSGLGLLQLALQVLLPPLILAAGVPPHRPLGLAV